MKITLELARQILREALGFDSFAASILTRIEEDENHPSAYITNEGILGYNPEFIRHFVKAKEELFCLLFHELLHPLFGHFIYEAGMLENIAADAIINAAISSLYAHASGSGALFRETYQPKGLEGLLRPDSEMEHSRFAGVYEKLYQRTHLQESAMTTGELIQTLKILCDAQQNESVMLLGSHANEEEQETDGQAKNRGLAGLSLEQKARLAEEIQESAKRQASKCAGFSQTLLQVFMEALKTHLSIRRRLLQQFATKRKTDRFLQRGVRRQSLVSPIPLHPSKRDLTLLAAGLYPFHFHSQIQRPHDERRGLAVYLDVSGSVEDHLPQILSVLRPLQNEIATAFQFSNQVVETPFRALLQGKIQTTYGTDFDCVARSILERGYDKALIFTDGYAALDEELAKQLKEQRVAILCVLFAEGRKCDPLVQVGDLVALEDIVQ